RNRTASSGYRSGCWRTRPTKSNAASIRPRIVRSSILFVSTFFPLHQRSIPPPVPPQVLPASVHGTFQGWSAPQSEPFRRVGAPIRLPVKESVEVVVTDDLSPGLPDAGRIRDGESVQTRGATGGAALEFQVHVDSVVLGQEDCVGFPLGHFMSNWTSDDQVLQACGDLDGLVES